MKRMFLFLALLVVLPVDYPSSLCYSQFRTSVFIVSQPATLAEVGRLYQYQILAVSSRPSDTLRYRLWVAPEGMTIDSLSGLITWVPPAVGGFAVSLIASNQRGERAAQEYKLRVVSFLGTIAGIVRNDSGVGIRRIIVTLYSAISVKNYPRYRNYWAMTDSSGRFAIADVDSGTYVAYAVPLCHLLMSAIPCSEDDYLPIWYRDSPTIAGATQIAVKDSNTVRVDLVMYRRVRPVPVTVSGKVTDTTGEPIRGAGVVVSSMLKSPIMVNSSLPTALDQVSNRVSDASFGVFPDVMAFVKTDSLGEYKVAARSGWPYIAACFAGGYLLQFYKEKENALEADRMLLTRDSSGVDFRLQSIPKAVGKIGGVVQDSGGVGVPSRVILYCRTPVSHAASSVRTAHSDSLGNFLFEALPNGSYILQAVPFREYLPSFYNAGGCGVFGWRRADTIRIQGNTVDGLVVCVKKASAWGAGTIGGRIAAVSGSALAGVVVLAIDQDDPSLATSAVTDAEGGYELVDLDPGTYSVSVDKVAYESPGEKSGVVDYAKSEGTLNFTMSPEPVAPGDEAGQLVPEEYRLLQNYPNPFNPSTVIEFDLPKGDLTTLRLYNILGQKVETLVDSYLPAGHYTLEFTSVGRRGSELPSGIYLYELRSGSFVSTRKMILVK